MDVSHILSALNDAQRQAVAATPGPLLVLAGAGSGKTRVLTHRIAWLVEALQVRPSSILAVTFTNKAAQEMRARIAELLQVPVGGMWIGTFHGLCHRLLRLHFEDAGLPQEFEIIDSDDQYRLVRRVLREAGIDEAHYPPRSVQWTINAYKDEGCRASDIPQSDDPRERNLQRAYAAYQAICQRGGLVDFAELLLRTLELFRNNQVVRESWQRRFAHVLVDEFQDTNNIQYRWLRLLSEGHKNIFAVGDDDQSIYGWRGARVENLLNFERDFGGATVLRLEQNYRSSGTILNAANAVISHNSGRMGKELWTDRGDGAPIRLYAASNELDEARFVVDEIRHWADDANPLSSVAILYRSNAQSRVFEEKLLYAGLPYRVYGGMRFFERAEIKDALAYLRLLNHRDSDVAFARVVNLPSRGIGAKSLEAVRERAQAGQISLWQAAAQIIAGGGLPARARSALHGFCQLIERLAESTANLELGEMTEHVLNHSGLLEYYGTERGERAEGRVENLKELVTATENFSPELGVEDADGVEMEPLAQFLAHAALEAGEEQAVASDDCVQLMSLHSAKGLEFPLVFLCGMEEGLFPHQRSLDEESGRLEEERRLCYVGMTRAMRQLVICYAEVRRLYGRENYARCSRFVDEIPPQFLDALRLPKTISSMSLASTSVAAAGDPDLRPGSRVRHSKFGEGTVLSLEGQGEHARVEVNFGDQGAKWLVYGYAKLEVL